MMPVGIPPMSGASAGLANVDTYFDPAITDPPMRNGEMYSIYIG